MDNLYAVTYFKLPNVDIIIQAIKNPKTNNNYFKLLHFLGNAHNNSRAVFPLLNIIPISMDPPIEMTMQHFEIKLTVLL